MRTREAIESALRDEIYDVQAELARIQLVALDEKNTYLLSSHIKKLQELDLEKTDVVDIYRGLLNTCMSNDELKKYCAPSVKKLLKAIQTYKADLKKCNKRPPLKKSSSPSIKYDFAIAMTNIIARENKIKLEDRITKLVKNELIYQLLLEEGEITGKKKLIEFFKDYAKYQQDPTKEKFNEIKRKFLANKEFIKFLSEDLMKNLGDLGKKYKTKAFSAALGKVAGEVAIKLKEDAVIRDRAGLLLHERQQFSNLVTQLSALKEESLAEKEATTEKQVTPKKAKPNLFKLFKAKFTKKSKQKEQEKTKTHSKQRGVL